MGIFKKKRDLTIFIDGENAAPLWAIPLYVYLVREYSLAECYVIGNTNKIASDYHRFEGKHFHLVNSMTGKNSADTWLVMMATEALCSNKVNNLAVFSNDRDFAPLARLAAEKKKQITLYAKFDSGNRSLLESFYKANGGDYLKVQLIDGQKPIDEQVEKPKPITLKERVLKFLDFKNNFNNKSSELAQQLAQMKEKQLQDKGKVAPPKVANAKKPKAPKAPKPKKKPVPAKIPFSATDGRGQRLYEEMPASIHNYYDRRGKKGKVSIVLAKDKDGEFIELPFINGMVEGVFTEMISRLKICPEGTSYRMYIKSLGLIIKHERLFYGVGHR